MHRERMPGVYLCIIIIGIGVDFGGGSPGTCPPII